MIVGYSFKGDNNHTLKWVQHDLYWGLLPSLLEHAMQKYREASEILGVRAELASKITDISPFNHRVLQATHDIIAAYYRFKYPDKEGQLILPFSFPDDGGKDPVETLKKLYAREWCEFWYREIKELTRNGEIVRSLLTSVAYQNTNRGYDAEDLLCKLLEDLYSLEE